MSANVEFLRKISIFAELPEEQLTEVSSLFRMRKYRKNDIVFFEEDTGQYMYLVREGRVKVTRLLPNGKEMKLRVRKEEVEQVNKLRQMDDVHIIEGPQNIRRVFTKYFK